MAEPFKLAGLRSSRPAGLVAAFLSFRPNAPQKPVLNAGVETRTAHEISDVAQKPKEFADVLKPELTPTATSLRRSALELPLKRLKRVRKAALAFLFLLRVRFGALSPASRFPAPPFKLPFFMTFKSATRAVTPV